MIFLYPHFLFIFCIPLLFWLYLIYSRKKSVFSNEVKKRLSTAIFKKKYTYNPFLWLLFFLLITLTLARPVLFEELKKEDHKVTMGFLSINLDISKSMLANDIKPNRLEFSKNVISTIFKKMPYFRISLNAFSKDIFMVSPFTEDKETLTFLLETLDENSMTSQGSSIEAVMMGAQKNYLPFKVEKKDVLIVTDGADGLEIKEAINKAKEYNLRVHLLIVGTKEGSNIKDHNEKVIKDKNGKTVITKREDKIKNLAIETGGVYVITNGSLSDLDWLCEQIAIKAQREETMLIKKNHTKELFYFPLFSSVIVLFFILNTLYINNLKKILPLILLSFILPQNLQSDTFDFLNIIKAQGFYHTKRHKQGLEYFKKVNESKKTGVSKYNLANSYYRNREYKKAIKLYKNIKTTNKILDYERLHNLGNAYVKIGLNKEAIDVYKRALKIKKAKATQFNLSFIQKFKLSSKSKNQNKTKKDDKKKKNSKNKKQLKKSKMNKKESKKWEKMLKNVKPQTKPLKLIENNQVEKNNEIFW